MAEPLRGWFQHPGPTQLTANRRGRTGSPPNFCGRFRLKRGRSAVESRRTVARKSLNGPQICDDAHSSPFVAIGSLRPDRRSPRTRRGLSGQTEYRPAGLAPICRRRLVIFCIFFRVPSLPRCRRGRVARRPGMPIHARGGDAMSNDASPAASPGGLRVRS